MNKTTQNGAARIARVSTTHKVAPISRAIRAALAVSATMLTLFAPAASWAAGTCTYDAVSNTYACNGDFSQPIPDVGFIPPADLTIVVGDQQPTSVLPGFGQVGIEAEWAGNVSVLVNAGSSIATSGADGIQAYGTDAATSVTNDGSITTTTTASGGSALDVGGVYDVTVVNGGDLIASDTSGSYDVITANVFSSSGDISIDNQAAGSISASAYGGNATALSAISLSDYGSINISNEGVINADSVYGNATALSAVSLGDYGSINIGNEGAINADSVYGSATGISASAVKYGYTTVQNSGNIQVNGYERADGIYAFGDYSSRVENSGDISATANAVDSDATAYGVTVRSYNYPASNPYDTSGHVSYLDNDASGSIVATAHSSYGSASAVGAFAAGGNVTTLHNYGVISASASSDYGNAQAYGAVVAGSSGTALLVNGGDINANASAGAGASAGAVGAGAYGGAASIFNDANISATATAGDGGTATATGALAEGTNVAINTYGDLSATATAVGGTAKATGAYLYGQQGSATFYNAGDLSATAIADTGVATAVGAESIGIYNSYVTNKGTISSSAAGGQAKAAGLINESYFVAQTTNAGNVSVVADGTLAPYGQYEAVATGIYTYSVIYDAVTNNTGKVSAVANATADIDDAAGFLVAKAIGVQSVNRAGYGQALIDNSGDISASAVTGHGYASAWGAVVQSGSYGNGDAEIDNDGTISASTQSGDGSVATTIGAYVRSGDTATIVNHGDIVATSRAELSVLNVSLAGSYATGVKVLGFAYGSGGASVSNYGNIEADASIEGGYVGATALQIYGSTATIYNAQGATILASEEADLFGSGGATAVEAGGKYGVNLINNGDITASGHSHGTTTYSGGYTYDRFATSHATGVDAVANYLGNISVVNNGDILAHAVTSNGITFFNAGAGATGVSVYAKYDAVVENTGSIAAIAASDVGAVAAYGVMNRSKYYSHIINDAGASIVASATVGSLSTDQYGGRAVSFGTHTFGNGSTGVTYNAGSIVSHAVVTADGGANEGHSMASAWGASIGAYSSMEAGTIINVGDIEADASADFGYATAFGSYVLSQYDSITSNTGTIQSSATANNGDAFAVGAYGFALHAQYVVDCSSGTCDYANAKFVPDAGIATLDNSGQITAVATAVGGTGHAYGATVLGAFDSEITNSGHISASVDADDARAVGALTNSGYGYATLQNTSSGVISAVASGDVASASGAFIAGAYGNSHLAATVDNQGSILAKATGDTTAAAIGIEAIGWKDDGAQINNAGTIGAGAYGPDATATGVSMAFQGANTLTNSGDITAVATATGGAGLGYGAKILDASVLGITSSGHISSTVDADDAGAMGVLANSTYGDATLQNSGGIGAIASGNTASANGISITGASGNVYDASGHVHNGHLAVTIDNQNQSSILAKATGTTTASATGIESISLNEDGIQIDNAGTVGAGAYGADATATAVSMNSLGSNVLTSSGDITAVATATGGEGLSYGVTIVDASVLGITNKGHISSTVDADDAGAMGVLANSTYGDATLQNSGSINAIASGNTASASGITITGASGNADNGHLAVTIDNQNQSSILAKATGATTATATGIESISLNEDGIQIDNAGTVGAGAYGADATATAVSMNSLGSNVLTSSGDITAVATATGGEGLSYGVTIVDASVLGITNKGHISSTVDADDAGAMGVLANSTYGDATLQNSGSINAIASGNTASASGISITGASGNADNGHLAVTIDNQNQSSILAKATGTTTATATGIAAVGLNSDGVQIANAGTIAAAAYGAGATATAVSMDSLGSNVLTNTGTIGAFGDGTRIAVSSGIGATAAITNQGSITGAITTGALDDSFDNATGATWHAVGSSDFGDGDDHVVNHGTLFMDDAAIHLGSYVNGNTFDNFGTINVAGANNVIDMDNPFPVNNNGVISFVDGAPDDVLTIAGDFGGDGTINVDVSGLHQTSDLLYVTGNVIDSTKQTINVNLLDAPTAPRIDIPVITAKGTVAGNFTLGKVNFPTQGFVTADIFLKSTAKAESLDMDVTGLNSTGSLATSFAPGAQSMVNSEIGTWRQRMGVVPEQGNHGLAPWVRTFSDSGDVNPDRSSNFGSGGNGDFHQSNQGLELGVDTRLLDHLSAGVLIAKSDGNQRLTGGAGSDRLAGRTFGLYGTWLAENSFYFDISQRWTSIRGHLRSATGTMLTADASASAFNVETGFTAWTMAGIHVVPQVQYTHTKIDDISSLYSQQSDFAGNGGVSSRGRVGVSFDKTIQGESFSWTPYGSVNALREFNGKYGYTINSGLLGSTSTRGTSGMAELGLGARRGALSITGGVNWTDGGALNNFFGGQLVVRYSW